ncbi:MAG: zinc finger MYND domain-containing protein [Chlamydiae bacterium]|nr:zinc finger MYND domain-containing protein [Chlamydiota bacterium]
MKTGLTQKLSSEATGAASSDAVVKRDGEEKKAVTVFKKVHCQHCDKLLESPKNCGKCKVVYYCDQGCQRNDWTSHKTLCVKYPDTFEIESDQELFSRIATCFERSDFFHVIFHFKYKGEDAKAPPHKFRIIHNPQALFLKAGFFQIKAPRIFAHENLPTELVKSISSQFQMSYTGGGTINGESSYSIFGRVRVVY